MAAHKGHVKTGGRQRGTCNKVSCEIRELARVHGPAGIERLAEIAFNDAPFESQAVNNLKALIEEGVPSAEIAKFVRGAFALRSDQTCVMAIKELFDRGYGKAIQPIAGDGDGNPILVENKTVIVLPSNGRDLPE